MEEMEAKEKKKRRYLNIAWLVCGGWLCAVLWYVIGGIFYMTYIGRGLGKQCFRLAKYALWPHDTTAMAFFWNAPLANLLWWFPWGVLLFQVHLVAAGAFCITIIGVPIGKQYFRMALIAMSPFSVEYEKKELFEPYYPENY
jgi:uncharacterized membrane protein YccF (DUF307 family)